MTSRETEPNQAPTLLETDNGVEDVLHRRVSFPQRDDHSSSASSTSSASTYHIREQVQQPRSSTIKTSTSHTPWISIASAETTDDKTTNPKPNAIASLVKFVATNDVLLGRGKPFQSHHGNQYMHGIVDSLRAEYFSTDTKGKHSIIQHVMDLIKQRGGRFLVSLKTSEYWEEVKQSVAYRKVGHAFRSKVRQGSDFSDQEEKVQRIPVASPSSESSKVTKPSETKSRSSLPNKNAGYTASAVAAANRMLGGPLPSSLPRSLRGEPQDIYRGAPNETYGLADAAFSGDLNLMGPSSGGPSSLLSPSRIIPISQGNPAIEGGISSFMRRQQHHSMLLKDMIAAEERISVQRELFQQQQQQQQQFLLRQAMSGTGVHNFTMGNPLMMHSVGTPIQSPPMMPISQMLLAPNTTFSNAALGSLGSNMMPNYSSGGGINPTLELLLLERRRTMFREQYQRDMLAVAAMNDNNNNNNNNGREISINCNKAVCK